MLLLQGNKSATICHRRHLTGRSSHRPGHGRFMQLKTRGRLTGSWRYFASDQQNFFSSKKMMGAPNILPHVGSPYREVLRVADPPWSQQGLNSLGRDPGFWKWRHFCDERLNIYTHQTATPFASLQALQTWLYPVTKSHTEILQWLVGSVALFPVSVPGHSSFCCLAESAAC